MGDEVEHVWIPSGVERGKGWCSCGWPWSGLEAVMLPGKTYRRNREEWEEHVRDAGDER